MMNDNNFLDVWPSIDRLNTADDNKNADWLYIFFKSDTDLQEGLKLLP